MRTTFCLSNLINVKPDYNSDISFSLSGFASYTPNLAHWVSMQFMINFNEFKTNPLQQYIAYLFLFIYVLFPEGENGKYVLCTGSDLGTLHTLTDVYPYNNPIKMVLLMRK